jgi:hypothetical protein
MHTSVGTPARLTTPLPPAQALPPAKSLISLRPPCSLPHHREDTKGKSSHGNNNRWYMTTATLTCEHPAHPLGSAEDTPNAMNDCACVKLISYQAQVAHGQTGKWQRLWRTELLDMHNPHAGKCGVKIATLHSYCTTSLRMLRGQTP